MQEVSRDNYRLTDFRSLGQGLILLRFINGAWVQVDLADLIAKGNMFARWADDTYLAQGQIGDYGFWLEWPGDLDLAADTLWHRGVPADCPSDMLGSDEPLSNHLTAMEPVSIK